MICVPEIISNSDSTRVHSISNPWNGGWRVAKGYVKASSIISFPKTRDTLTLNLDRSLAPLMTTLGLDTRGRSGTKNCMCGNYSKSGEGLRDGQLIVCLPVSSPLLFMRAHQGADGYHSGYLKK